MANEFYVQVVDLAGNALANKQFYVYPTKAAALADIGTNNGTGKQTTVQTQPISTDASGEATFSVSDANVQTVYMRVVSESYVEGVRCVNEPLFTDYDSATPASGDIILFVDISDSNKIKRCTVAEMVTVMATLGLVSWSSAAGYTPKRLLLGTGTTTPAEGDVKFVPES
jgi:hypothetical protein